MSSSAPSMVLIPVGKLNETVGAGLLGVVLSSMYVLTITLSIVQVLTVLSVFMESLALKRLSFETATTISIAYFRV
jgi:hypothetical protein